MAKYDRFAGHDDFDIVFPSEHTRGIFYAFVSQLEYGDDSIAPADHAMQYEYESDERNQRIVLGRGGFGTVYSARDLDTMKMVS